MCVVSFLLRRFAFVGGQRRTRPDAQRQFRNSVSADPLRWPCTVEFIDLVRNLLFYSSTIEPQLTFNGKAICWFFLPLPRFLSSPLTIAPVSPFLCPLKFAHQPSGLKEHLRPLSLPICPMPLSLAPNVGDDHLFITGMNKRSSVFRHTNNLMAEFSPDLLRVLLEHHAHGRHTMNEKPSGSTCSQRGILGDPESKAELGSLVVRMLCGSTQQDSLFSVPGVYRKKDLDKRLILRVKPNNKTAAVVAGSNATRDVHISQLPEIPEVTTQCIWLKKNRRAYDNNSIPWPQVWTWCKSLWKRA